MIQGRMKGWRRLPLLAELCLAAPRHCRRLTPPRYSCGSFLLKTSMMLFLALQRLHQGASPTMLATPVQVLWLALNRRLTHTHGSSSAPGAVRLSTSEIQPQAPLLGPLQRLNIERQTLTCQSFFSLFCNPIYQVIWVLPTYLPGVDFSLLC